MGNVDYAPIITTVLSVFGAIVAATLTFIAGRRQANASAQVTIAQGFEILVKKLQEERVELTRVIEKQSEHIEDQATQIGQLRGEVQDLRSQLKDALSAWKRGEPVPNAAPTGNR